MESHSREAIQSAVFSDVARIRSEHFEHNISMCPANDLPREDLLALQRRGKLSFSYDIKAQPWGSPVSALEHLVNSVIYYGEPVDLGYSCIGYVIGCVNDKRQAIEIYLMEKRNDAGSEWQHQFLPLVVDAYAAYGLYLNAFEGKKINKLVLVGPVQDVIKYYLDKGFRLVRDYADGEDAMVLSLDQI
ncbi:hypothetical protein D6089_09610 [Vibrio vulnificus]|nr:hypothetical protein [Vibrio vulnificus]EIY8041236.1 hypothetical protein [Vibrio vulnificus]